MLRKVVLIRSLYILTGFFVFSCMAELSSSEDIYATSSKSLRVIPIRTLESSVDSSKSQAPSYKEGSSSKSSSGTSSASSSNRTTSSESSRPQSAASSYRETVTLSKQASGTPATRTIPKTEGLITVEGVVTALEPEKDAPSIQILLSNRKTWTVHFEPGKSSIISLGSPGGIEDLQVGERVKATYAPVGGIHLLRVLEVLDNVALSGSNTLENKVSPPAKLEN